MQLVRQAVETAFRRRGVRFSAATPVISRHTAAKHDAVVVSQPEVIEDSSRIDDAFAPTPTDHPQRFGVKRFGSDNLQVYRQDSSAQHAKTRCVTRGRDDYAIRDNV